MSEENGLGVGGTDAAATLSLGVQTFKAVEELDALERKSLSALNTLERLYNLAGLRKLEDGRVEALTAEVARLERELIRLGTDASPSAVAGIAKGTSKISDYLKIIQGEAETTGAKLKAAFSVNLDGIKISGGQGVAGSSSIGATVNELKNLENEVIQAANASGVLTREQQKLAESSAKAALAERNYQATLKARWLEQQKASEASDVAAKLKSAEASAKAALEERNYQAALKARWIEQQKASTVQSVLKDATFNMPSNLTSQGKSAYFANSLIEVGQMDQALVRYGKSAVDAAANWRMYTRSVSDGNGILKDSAEHHKLWTKNAWEAHAAARGLAGSLGTLWMTYGATVPLLAGAAVGTMLKDIASVGKTLEYQLRFVEVLGGQALQLKSYMDAVRGSMFTPSESVEGMRALAQAGLTVKESLASLPAVLNLATIGEMGVGEAALALTGIMHAFNLQISDMDNIGDVFSKAAAVSNTSVQGMTEAMKQASTVSSLYGVSIEQTASALAIMAQRNIEGSAAGTAFRNALKELYSPSTKKAEEAIKSIGLTTSDSAGHLKGFDTVITELRGKILTLNDASAQLLLNTIFGERGAKAVSSIIFNFEEYNRIAGEVANSNGFMSRSVIALQDTVQGASVRMRSNLESNLVAAFDKLNPVIREVVDSLAEVFGSEAFLTALTKLGGGVAMLTMALVDNVGAVTTLFTVYMGFKAIQWIAPVLANLTTSIYSAGKAYSAGAGFAQVMAASLGLTRVEAAAASIGMRSFQSATEMSSTAILRATTVNAAAATSTGLLSASVIATGSGFARAGTLAASLISKLNPLILIATTLYGVYEILTFNTDKASQATDNYASGASSRLIKALDSEISRLERKIGLQKESIAVDKQTVAMNREDLINQLNKAKAKVALEEQRVKENGTGWRRMFGVTGDLNEARSEVTKLQQELNVVDYKLSTIGKLERIADMSKGFRNLNEEISRLVSVTHNVMGSKDVTAYRDQASALEKQYEALSKIDPKAKDYSRSVNELVRATNALKGKVDPLMGKWTVPDSSKASKGDPFETYKSSIDQVIERRREEYEIGNKLTQTQVEYNKVVKSLSDGYTVQSGKLHNLTAAERAALETRKSQLAPMAELDQAYSDLREKLDLSSKSYDLSQKSLAAVNAEREKERRIIAASMADDFHASALLNMQAEVDAQKMLNEYLDNTNARITEVSKARDAYYTKSVASGLAETELVKANIKSLDDNIETLRQQSREYQSQINLKKKLLELDPSTDYAKYRVSLEKDLTKTYEKQVAELAKVEKSLIVQPAREKAAVDARIAAENEYTDNLAVQALKVRELRGVISAAWEVLTSANDFESLDVGLSTLTSAEATLNKVLTDQLRIRQQQKSAGDAAAESAQKVYDITNSWSFGVNKAVQDYIDGVSAMSSTSYASVSDLLKSTEDNLVNFIMRSKSEFKSLKSYLIDIFSNLVIRPTIKATVAMVMSGGAAGAAQASPIGAAASAYGSATNMAAIFGSAGAYFQTGLMTALTGGEGLLGGVGLGLGAASDILGAGLATGSLTSALSGLTMGLGSLMPVIGAVAAIASLIGKKPSDKTAWGNIDLSSNSLSNVGGMSGDKAPSQDTMTARDAMLKTAGDWADVLRALGGTVNGQVRLSTGERDGFRADFGADGVREIVEKDAQKFFLRLFEVMAEGASGLDQVMRGLLTTFQGTADEALAYGKALVAVNDYSRVDLISTAMDQIKASGRTAYNVWQDATNQAKLASNAFNGTLTTAQELGTAVNAMYQSELAIVGQIQGVLASTSSMIQESIRTIDLSILDNAGKYDYLRTEIDKSYETLMTAVDPTVIGDLVSQIDKLTMETWGMLSEDQRPDYAEEYKSYLEDVNKLAAERLNAGQEQIKASHQEMVDSLSQALGGVAQQMMEAANRQQAAANTPVTVQSNIRITVDKSGNVTEVGYG